MKTHQHDIFQSHYNDKISAWAGTINNLHSHSVKKYM